jgi:7-carboxy-7-deazaguanine synthase
MTVVVNEIFESIQGEGIHTGLITTFIRLSGCNLRCKWCDTTYSLSEDDGTPLAFEDIIEKIGSNGSDMICLTGGEPLVQEGTRDLIERFLESGYRVDLETNGTKPIEDLPLKSNHLFISMDVKTPSSKEVDGFIVKNLKYLRKEDQLKFIVQDDVDVEFVFDFIKKHLPVCTVILTPCFNKGGDLISSRMIQEIDEVKEGPYKELLRRTRLMIQEHKVIWPPERRGV